MPRRVKRLAVIDLETDPFSFGTQIKTFCAGFYDGDSFVHFWSPNCIDELADYLADRSDADFIIYAHNGGKFDFLFMLEHIENPIKIINGRIVKAKIGRHEIRDSFAIIPVPLAAYQKDSIDYEKFKAENRDAHRDEIVSYLKTDCVALFDLVAKFHERFGKRLTIGGTAIAQLKLSHPLQNQSPFHDLKFRPYYAGGRCEFFEQGDIRGNFQVFDVNSMYPYVMREYDHPLGSHYLYSSHIEHDKPYFARIDATSSGALPLRQKSGLTFPHGRAEFFACSHEIRTALDCGALTIHKVIECYSCEDSTRFDKFVDLYSAEKIAAKKRGDKASEIFAKLLLNSSYGKFAQNPENYFDYKIRIAGRDLIDPEYELYLDYGDVEIWRKPAESNQYLDVAIAASITSASRAELFKALSVADRPLYCDTDSIICRDLPGVEISDTKLGAWKREAKATRVAIAGKKLYACFDGRECVKHASKGVQMEANDILACAKGKTIYWEKPSPCIKLDGSMFFLTRAIKSRENKSAAPSRLIR